MDTGLRRFQEDVWVIVTSLMQYQSWRRSPREDLEYDAVYRFAETESPFDTNKLLLDLNLTITGAECIRAEVLIQTGKNLILNPARVSLANRNTALSLELFPLQERDSQNITVNVVGERFEEQLQLTIPSVEALHLCQDIVQGKELEPIIEQAEALYDKTPVAVFYRILRDAAICLNFKDYLTVRNRLMGYSGRLKHALEGSRLDSFRNMITANSKGKHQQLCTAFELWERVSTYNQFPNLAEIKKPEVVMHFLEYRYTENPEALYQENRRKYLEPVIYETEFLECCSDIPEPYFAVHLASLVEQRDLATARVLIETWVDVPEGLDYKTTKEGLLDRDQYGDKADGFRPLLVEAAEQSDHEFKFILVNYLYWRGRDYEARSQYMDLQPLLFSSAHAVAQILGGLTEIEERANYYANLTEGHLFKFHNPSRAASQYRRAIDIAQRQDSAWIGSRYNYLIPPVRHKTEADVTIYKQQEKFEEGVDILKKRIDLLTDLKNINPDQQEYALNLLRGWQAELEAHHLLKSQELGDVVAETKQKFGEANGYFDSVDRDDLQNGVRGRITELEAVEAEFQGEFDEAADIHEQYADQFPQSKGSGYHTRAALTCRARGALLAGDYRQAAQKIEEIETLASLDRDQRILRILADTSTDYHEGQLSDPSEVYHELGGDVAQDEHILDIPSDYTAAVTQILAAQRLRGWEVKEELLDRLVKQSLKDSLIPASIDEIDSGELEDLLPLQKASIADRWKRELPLNVYDGLVRVEEDEGNTVRYDSLVWDLAVYCLDRQLSAVVEYHGKKQWGDAWKTELYERQGIDKPSWKDPALGDLLGFFRLEPGQQLDCADRIIELDKEEIIHGISINKIRNDIAHGNTLRVADSETEYEQIREKLIELLKLLFTVTPTAVIIDRWLDDGYYLRLLRKAQPDRTKIQYTGELQEQEIYYLPPDLEPSAEEPELTSSEIVHCEVLKGLDDVISKV
ncbi:hypothetical protein [Halalkalicoccus tibetensis]|uniref:Uncharacterized protein n=1 Tax=Halalkalicoccus tibetensis TaxID=175632 RepID=A0ABD5V6L9_9EURY